ncbi:MAG: vWA domain-containing protein [Gemmataceae bacterium]
MAAMNSITVRRLGLAATTSLLLHGLLFMLLALRDAPGRERDDTGPYIDNRVTGPDIFLTLEEWAAPARPRLLPVAWVEDAAPLPVVVPAPASSPTPWQPASAVAALPTADPSTDTSSPSDHDAASNTQTGASAATTFFQIPATGQAVVYVIDGSASMGLFGRFDAARRELIASLEQLPTTARFHVIVYNRFVAVLPGSKPTELLPATPTNLTKTIAWLRSLRPEGGTDHLPALRRALLLRPDVLYFLTDADDLLATHVQELTNFNQNRTRIHALEMEAPNPHRADMPLQLLARWNNGRYRCVAEVIQGTGTLSRP